MIVIDYAYSWVYHIYVWWLILGYLNPVVKIKMNDGVIVNVLTRFHLMIDWSKIVKLIMYRWYTEMSDEWSW